MADYHLAVWLLLVIVCSALGACPNSCSGHGLCGTSNTCTCFEGWDAGAADCSFRTCPTGTAWVDKAYGVDLAHQTIECSNAGICDRQQGLCKCFPGFTGSACQRSTCPNDCNGHGKCGTIKEISYFSGTQYSESVSDGTGIQYSNWDKDSIQFCECDDGYFGSDCSLVMCPKGDDPLSTNQESKQIKMRVRSYLEDLSGMLGLRFQGKTIFFKLETFSTSNATCNDKFAFQGKFANVGCNQITHSSQHFEFDLTFYSWPVYPKDNNLYVNDGNPSIGDFYCDTSFASKAVFCEFVDVMSTNIKEYSYCSNRGSCSFQYGTCTCIDGYGGPACSNSTYSYASGSSASPGMIVNVDASNFTSSAIHIQTAKSAAADFKMLEAVANGQSMFYIRGDGLVGVNKLLTLTGGHTVTGGGLAVVADGCTIFDGGLAASTSSSTNPVLRLTSKYQGLYSSASYSSLEINTYGTNPNSHYFLQGINRGKTMLQLRADGAILINGGGLYVTGGASIYSNGLTVSGGATINSGGLKITSGGLVATGGLTVNSNGVKISSGGLQVLGGGVSILSVGLRAVGGISVLSGGAAITGGVSVNSGGMKVTGGISLMSGGMIATGGVTVNNAGIYVVSGGVTIQSGGLLVRTEGTTIASGGLAITAGGIEVTAGGLTVSSGVAVFGNGIQSNAGVTVSNVPAQLFQGAYFLGGLTVSSSVFVMDGGLVVTTGGLTVNQGNVFANDGLLVSNGLTVYGGAQFQNTPTFFSDERLKTNISSIGDALKTVTSLRGVYFSWKQDGSHGMQFSKGRQLGVIAQQVQKVVPELVKGKESEGYLTVDYVSMVPLVVEAIGELSEKLNTAKSNCVVSAISSAQELRREIETMKLENLQLTELLVNVKKEIDSFQ